MRRFIHSLQTKLTLSFIVLVLVVSGLTFVITYRETKAALKEVLRDELRAVATVVATGLTGEDAERMATLKAGDETSPEFIRLRAKLQALRKAHPDLKYIYTMRRVDGQVRFLVDADQGNAEDPGGAIDEAYSETTPEMLQGFEGPAVENEFSTDKWGVTLSGYCPLKDTQGRVIGLVGVDIAADRVLAKQNFIGNTIYWVMGIGVLVAGLLILVFSMTIIRDIRRLNRVAEEISLGNMDVTMDVSRSDEIGELAESFGRMVASLKIMMMDKSDPQ